MPRKHSKIQRSCEVCGASFLTNPETVRKGQGRFCSHSCHGKTLAIPKASVACLFCGTVFVVRPSQMKRGRGRFCSLTCANRHTLVPATARFHKHIGPPAENGCIPWTGKIGQGGYGRIYQQEPDGTERQLAAHRVAYELTYGPISDDIDVLHRCDTPACVNPAHLFLGTQAQNVADMVAKNRQAKGTRNAFAKLNDDLVRTIRRRFAAGGVTKVELARDYGVGTTVIGNVVTRKTWRHVSDEPIPAQTS